jgi:hypothetical protein
VQAYTSGKLTKNCDKLVALSGVAHEMQRRAICDDSYLAGLWRRDLLFELLWDIAEPQSHKPHSHSGQYVAPSWSWASRTGEVTWETETWLSAEPLVRIEDAAVTRLGPDDMGQVSGGYVRLSGTLVRASLNRVHQPGSSRPRASRKVKDTTVYGATIRADDGFNFIDPIPPKIYCFPFFRSLRNRVPIYRGLLLVPSGTQNGRFRRYGTFTTESFLPLFLVSSSLAPLEGEICRPDGRCVITIL